MFWFGPTQPELCQPLIGICFPSFTGLDFEACLLGGCPSLVALRHRIHWPRPRLLVRPTPTGEPAVISSQSCRQVCTLVVPASPEHGKSLSGQLFATPVSTYSQTVTMAIRHQRTSAETLSRLRQLLGRREAKLAGVLLLLVVVAFGCWLGVRAFEAKSNLEQARNSAQQAKEALLQGDTEDASQWADDAHSHAQAARDATHSVPWNIASVVPWLGSPFKTGQQISDVVLGLAADVLQPSAHVGAAISPDRLLEGGRVDVQLLRDAAPELSKISAAAARLDADARAISDPTYLVAAPRRSRRNFRRRPLTLRSCCRIRLSPHVSRRR